MFQIEFRLKGGADAAYRWFLARGELVRDDSGAVHKWFGTWTDIDDQKRTEQELTRAHGLAESASRSKDQFLAMLSHELRTPLTPVLLIATASRDDPSTPDHLRPTFEVIRQNLELEARLIDDLLDVMRIIRGKLPYQFEVVDAHAQIARALEICWGEAEAKGLQLAADLGATDHHVRADAARLQQVLWNLIKNAVKFTPRGRIEIRTRSGPDGLTIAVADDGIGIDPPLLPLIFNAFEQGEDIITKRFGGLGLGLAISRSIIEGHGGRIEVASPGRGLGATFTIELPVAAPQPDAADDPAPPAGPAEAPAEATDGAAANLPDCHLLLVEDDVMTARIMAKLLRQSGYLVTTANSGRRGARGGRRRLQPDRQRHRFARWDRIGPDAGYQAPPQQRPRHRLDRLRDGGRRPRKAWQAGFVAHLTKPVDFAKLDSDDPQGRRRGHHPLSRPSCRRPDARGGDAGRRSRG